MTTTTTTTTTTTITITTTTTTITPSQLHLSLCKNVKPKQVSETRRKCIETPNGNYGRIETEDWLLLTHRVEVLVVRWPVWKFSGISVGIRSVARKVDMPWKVDYSAPQQPKVPLDLPPMCKQAEQGTYLGLAFLDSISASPNFDCSPLSRLGK
ncbi:hypothetical protein M0802_011776 [Mischocyttarus mexicanus]|nr:hypothetical protein M0802_011776 [Mischocyttarus mexicanus]